MAFNFNWSPLTADAEFYSRARDLLTKALNKSPKPPIIVDDILVSEFNLGTVPPDLEILEIGDLAEDRFRGIFKMTYSGDAYLTLKTRVQVRLAAFRETSSAPSPYIFFSLSSWSSLAPHQKPDNARSIYDSRNHDDASDRAASFWFGVEGSSQFFKTVAMSWISVRQAGQ